MACATTSLNLQLLISDISQYFTLSDAGQHSTRMRYYFHHEHNCFLDYFNDSVLDGAVIYADVLLWYDEQESTYTEFFGNPTGYMFLASSRDHKFLPSHCSTTLHVSCTPLESRKSNHDYINDSHSNSAAHMPVSSLDPSDP